MLGTAQGLGKKADHTPEQFTPDKYSQTVELTKEHAASYEAEQSLKSEERRRRRGESRVGLDCKCVCVCVCLGVCSVCVVVHTDLSVPRPEQMLSSHRL